MKTNFLELSGRLNQLVLMLQEETYESGTLNPSDYEFKSILKDQEFHPKDVYFLVFSKYLKAHINTKASILNMISRIECSHLIFDYSNIAKCGLKCKDNEVFEAAIRCFENWDYLIKELESVNLSNRPKWLKEYAIQVIQDLKKGTKDNG
jgi:hypothetical protein